MASIFNLQALISFAALVVFCLVLQVDAHETDIHKELLLTKSEKLAFDKFKSQVSRNLSDAHAFIKTDLFLLRWIRAKNLDVNRAVKDMFEFLAWRKKHNIDTIHQENWEDMFRDFPYRMDVVDLQGRPVAVGSIGGQWNIRRSALQGRLPRLSRYAFKLIEEVFQRTFEANKLSPNITQFSVIVSLEGFNVFQQACPLCLTTYIQLLSTYNRFYPNFAHAIIAINTPPAFNVVLDLLRPLLTRQTSDALRIYGPNKKQWKGVLDREVSENQLTDEFGGTKPDENDYQE